MTARDVIDLYESLERLGVEIWIDGGWCVDAPKLGELLQGRGYKDIKLEEARDWNFVLGDEQGREIDVHVIVLDCQGDGVYGPPENGEKYPAASLTGNGQIEGRTVRCISAEWTVKFHSGYLLKEKDFQDVYALCGKFGIALPPEYARFKKSPQESGRAPPFLSEVVVIKSFVSEVLHLVSGTTASRHIGVLLQTVEGEFLSRETAGQGDAALLRHAVLDGGD